MARRPKAPKIPSDEGRQYRIAPHPTYHIVVGVAGGDQVLVFPIGRSFLLLRFDRNGVLLGSSEHPITDKAAALKIRSQLLKSIGFKSRPIAVQRFYFPEFNLGIKRLWWFMEEAMEEPKKFHPDELKEIYSDIPEYVQSGHFMLAWGEDYDMDSIGRVISS